MTDSNNDCAEKLFIAIDIAKQSHDTLISWPSGKTKAVKISNALMGYRRLLDLTGSRPETVSVAFEPTTDTTAI